MAGPAAATLFLVHHAEAVGPEIDPTRPLSAAGQESAARLAGAAAARGVRPEAIWHSGKLRARQTAEHFRRLCGPSAALRAVPGLQPGDPPRRIRDQLLVESQVLLLVGHMPHLPALLALLTGRPDDDTSRPFPQHGLVALVRTGDRWDEVFRLEGV